MQLRRFIVTPGVFRMVLAYIVVVDHFTPVHLGSAAVYLFFMLSGFWVDRVWGKEYAPTLAPYRNFMVSRIWRLMPVYYVALAIRLLFDAVFGENRIGFHASAGWPIVHFWLSTLFIFGYASLPTEAKLISPVWSLDVELQFYLVAPILIAMLAKYPLLSGPRLILSALAIGGLVALTTVYGMHAQSAFLPMYLVFFLIGLHSSRQSWLPRADLALGGIGAVIGLTVGCFLLPGMRPLLFFGRNHGWISDYNADLNVVLALLAAAYAMSTVRRTVPTTHPRLARLDRDLGNVSYEVYLLHVNALSIVNHLFGHLSRHARLPIVIGALIALLPLSWIIYRFIDKPIDRVRTAWVRSRKRPLKDAPAILDADPLVSYSLKMGP